MLSYEEMRRRIEIHVDIVLLNRKQMDKIKEEISI